MQVETAKIDDNRKESGGPGTVEFYDSANLIAEVKKRPALYHKFCKEYNDKLVRERMWREVCLSIIPNWPVLDEKSKLRTAREVQRKWKNIRDCFRKELNNDRKCEEGRGRRKRRKYIFFDHLLFLLPSMQQREKREEWAGSSGEEDNNEDGGGSVNSDSSTSRPLLWRHGAQQHPVYMHKEPDPVPLVNDNSDIDHDKYFLLSLLPSFRGMSEQQKFTVKIEFLKTLQNVCLATAAADSAGAVSNVESSQNDSDYQIKHPKLESADDDDDY